MEAYFKTQVIVGNIGCWWVLVHSGHYLLLTIHGPQTSTFLAQLLHLLDDSIRPWYLPFFMVVGSNGGMGRPKDSWGSCKPEKGDKRQPVRLLLRCLWQTFMSFFLIWPSATFPPAKTCESTDFGTADKHSWGALSFDSSTSNAINFTIVIGLSHTRQLFTATCVPQPVTAHNPLFRSIELMG
jgi:hypothetical protein